MILEIPIQKTFECPEGAFRAALIEVRDHVPRGGVERNVRFVFEPRLPKKDGKVVVVGKNYEPSLEPGKELRIMLGHWLGEEFFTVMQGRKLDLQKLVGKEADIITRHFQNSRFDKPFVNLVGVYPPGTQTATNTASNQQSPTVNLLVP